MTTSSSDVLSLLAIDVGTATTRAFYFDGVASSYRFVAVGEAASTYAPPVKNTAVGIRNALQALTKTTGLVFLDQDDELITPAAGNGVGVDTIVATVSAVDPLKIHTVGLLENYSLESANRLAARVYSEITDSFAMNDRRPLPERIATILSNRPDLIIVAGGTEGGARGSLLKLLEPIRLANLAMEAERQTKVLFAGNSKIAPEVQEALGELPSMKTAANLRPALQFEQLGPAEETLREIFRQIYTERDQGLRELDSWASGQLLPAAAGFGRIIQFLAQSSYRKPVLGIDVGAGSLVVAAAQQDHFKINVFSDFGVGLTSEALFSHTTPGNIASWLPFEMSANEIQDFVLNKAAHPNSVPMTDEEAALEMAITRELLASAMKKVKEDLDLPALALKPGLLPVFEPIIVSGDVLANAANLGHALLAILDAVEPVGVTVVLLDNNGIMSTLGAAAAVNSLLAVQVLESGVLKSLGTVIAPVGKARKGTTILRIRMELESGEERKVDIQQGSLTAIPLEAGLKAELHLQPLSNYDIGLGWPGRGGTLRVVGGKLGVVIDARGRPLKFPKKSQARREAIQSWRTALGGEDR